MKSFQPCGTPPNAFLYKYLQRFRGVLSRGTSPWAPIFVILFVKVSDTAICSVL
jgi:hypothetical protein